MNTIHQARQLASKAIKSARNGKPLAETDFGSVAAIEPALKFRYATMKELLAFDGLLPRVDTRPGSVNDVKVARCHIVVDDPDYADAPTKYKATVAVSPRQVTIVINTDSMDGLVLVKKTPKGQEQAEANRLRDPDDYKRLRSSGYKVVQL